MPFHFIKYKYSSCLACWFRSCFWYLHSTCVGSSPGYTLDPSFDPATPQRRFWIESLAPDLSLARARVLHAWDNEPARETLLSLRLLVHFSPSLRLYLPIKKIFFEMRMENTYKVCVRRAVIWPSSRTPGRGVRTAKLWSWDPSFLLKCTLTGTGW